MLHMNTSLTVKCLLQIRGIGSKEEFAAWASTVHQKVLVIYGRGDHITPLNKAQNALISKFKQCTVLSIDGSSHQVMQEKPDEVNAAILRFIEML